MRKEVSCSPCLKRECPRDHRCMELITVEEVEKVVIEQLEGTDEKRESASVSHLNDAMG